MRVGTGGLAHGHEVLVDPAAHFEPVGIVVEDQLVGGIEDGLVRAEIFREHDLLGARVVLEEADDVGDRGSPPPIDGLVVVGDHGDVAMPRG